MDRKRRILTAIAAACILIGCLVLGGCAAFRSFIGVLKGELFGNDYSIRQYDAYSKLVYVHRANVDIIPASLFQGEN